MIASKKEFKNIILIILGAFILAFGSYNFNYQNAITEGGVLGLLLFLKNVFDLSPSITNLILDLSLFIFGMRFFGKKFLYYSVLCTISFSIFYGILEQSPPIIPSFSEHMLIASLLAGLFVGIGVGLVILGGGAAGGDDVIALVFAKCTRLEVNHVYLISDLVVLFLSLSYLSSKQISYSLIAVYTSGKIISIFHRSLPDTNLMSGLVQ